VTAPAVFTGYRAWAATPPKEILGELFTVLYIFVGSGNISSVPEGHALSQVWREPPVSRFVIRLLSTG
jgi:hypothetical protein